MECLEWARHSHSRQLSLLCRRAAGRRDRRPLLREEASKGAVRDLVEGVCSRFAGTVHTRERYGVGHPAAEGTPVGRRRALESNLDREEAGSWPCWDSTVPERSQLLRHLEHLVVD